MAKGYKLKQERWNHSMFWSEIRIWEALYSEARRWLMYWHRSVGHLFLLLQWGNSDRLDATKMEQSFLEGVSPGRYILRRRSSDYPNFIKFDVTFSLIQKASIQRRYSQERRLIRKGVENGRPKRPALRDRLRGTTR